MRATVRLSSEYECMCVCTYCVCVHIMIYYTDGYRERNPYIAAVNELSSLILKRIL